MLKIVVHRPGSYDRLVLEQSAEPSAGPGEVSVACEAIGVNYADCIVRMGLYESAKQYVGYPITPGFEVAGRVRAVGDGVSDLDAGERVIALTRFGAYASQVVAPRSQVFRFPARFGFAEMAGFPTVFLTAWYALHELCKLRAGMNVLVHSAAGGVGSALVQLAKLGGCRVIGVVGGSHKIEAARRAGADSVIDKSREHLWQRAAREAPNGYDIVLDANGVETLRQSYRHLAPTGRLVIYGFHTMLPKSGGKPSWGKLALDWLRTPRFNPLALTNDNKSVLAFNLSYLFERGDLLAEGMTFLLEALENGRIAPLGVSEYPLARVADAHRAMESGRTVGKLVLVP